MEEYYEFLMFELGDVIDSKDNDDDRVNELMITLSAADGDIPETFFRLYTEYLPLAKERLYNALAYFTGIGEINVTCDCLEDQYLCEIHEIHKNDFYKHGKRSVGSSEQWYTVRMRVRELYADLWS